MKIQMQKVQQGFTLIELMIVVAIIGILAAVAIPAYQDYITRSKVTELVTAASSCKTSVSEYFQTTNQMPPDQTASGCASNPTQYMSGLSVAANTGVISATADTGPNKLPAAAAGDFILSPTTLNGTISWTCTPSTIPEKFLPANCR